MTVTVLDGVRDGFADGNEYITSVIWAYPGSGQPAAQGGAAAGEVVDVGGKVHLQWGRMAVEQQRNVVLITAAGRETRSPSATVPFTINTEPAATCYSTILALARQPVGVD